MISRYARTYDIIMTKSNSVRYFTQQTSGLVGGLHSLAAGNSALLWDLSLWKSPRASCYTGAGREASCDIGTAQKSRREHVDRSNYSDNV